jgi:two-component system heavy metal sensor histidine kinase CusS
MLPPRSLQNRLLLGFLLSMVAILALGGLVIYRAIATHLAEENDELLRDRLEFYRATMELGWHRTTPQAKFHMMEEDAARFERQVNPDLFQAWYMERGNAIPFRSPALLHKPDLPRIAATRGAVSFADALWDGRPARFCSVIFVPRKAGEKLPDLEVQLVVGRDSVALQDTLRDVRWFLVRMGLAVMALVLVISWLIIRRGVKPVVSLTHQIEYMPLADEATHFSLPGAPTELQPVVGRLNALMDRVSDAIEHERQFANNAAHELRNPLAAIRSSIELALSRTRKPEEYEATLESLLHSQQGMQRIVDHLLLLARLESGHRQSEFVMEPAVFGKMLKKSWLNCLDLAAEKNLRVTWQVTDAGTEIVVALSLASIVITNLMENAATYAPVGGEVRIHASLGDKVCRVAVENTNPGLRAEQMEDTFAPFWRADPNASGHRGNAGIGLALCRRICQTLGGKIEGAITAEGLVRYAVEIPVKLKS